MMRTSATIGVALLCAACAKQAGTTSPQACAAPEPTNLWVQGTDRLNPDASGEPLPTLIRAYQLTNVGALEQASFEEMMRQPEQVLGDTVLGVEELTVYPGRTAFRSFQHEPGASYVAAIAVVRRPSGTSWRTIIPMPVCGTGNGVRPTVRLVVDGYGIDGQVERETNPEGCPADDTECLRRRSSEY